jgi:hypothetical protein
MYNALVLEHLRMQQAELNHRLELAARFPRTPHQDLPTPRRSWWPRPRRSALRLAMVPLVGTRRTAACTDC